MSNRLRACVRAAFIGAMGCLVAASAGASTGTILVEGGGYSTPETIKLFVGLVGAGKQLCFITTASPTGSSEGSWFRPFGLTPKPILVTAENAETQAMADELSQCDGFYFDGGQPKFLSDAFLKNGRDTRALAAIRRRYSEGAPLGGSSAGAMIMGPNTLCACGLETSIKVMGGQPPEISPAFHILPVEIDAHAFVHNLYGRELVAMGQQKWPRMLVLDEGAAVVIPGDGSPWRVISNRTVALLRAPEHAAKPMTGFDISTAADVTAHQKIEQCPQVVLQQHALERIG